MLLNHAPICSSHDYISIGFDDNKLMFIYILVYMIFQYVFCTHICLAAQKEDILMETSTNMMIKKYKIIQGFFYIFCNFSRFLEIC